MTAPDPAKPAIVLIHGAFADASSWQGVIPILQRDGYRVVAVGARVTEIRSSHVPFISHRREVAALITEAARSTTP